MTQANRLLIIACSRRKNSQWELLPALQRYDGPTFRLLRRFLRQESTGSLDIYILSAKFGLISSNELIPTYEEKMTKKRSQELQSEVTTKLKDILNVKIYDNLCFCVGKSYFSTLDGYDSLVTSIPNEQEQNWTDEKVLEDLQHQPHLMIKLQENALLVAESLRDNYFKNTAKFITHLRRAMREAELGQRDDRILQATAINDLAWKDIQGEVVTFIDGGVGQVQMASPIPVLLRVGSYCVKTGERNIQEREQFGYYPVIFGDLEGGSKERRDFTDIVRITAELLGGLSALRRTPNLRVLMFHGPLMYLMNAYAGHTPFTEKDIDLFLNQYAQDSKLTQQLKEDFLSEARLDIYPKMTENPDEWVDRKLFEPLAWIAFLYRRLIE